MGQLTSYWKLLCGHSHQCFGEWGVALNQLGVCPHDIRRLQAQSQFSVKFRCKTKNPLHRSQSVHEDNLANSGEHQAWGPSLGVHLENLSNITIFNLWPHWIRLLSWEQRHLSQTFSHCEHLICVGLSKSVTVHFYVWGGVACTFPHRNFEMGLEFQ